MNILNGNFHSHLVNDLLGDFSMNISHKITRSLRSEQSLSHLIGMHWCNLMHISTKPHNYYSLCCNHIWFFVDILINFMTKSEWLIHSLIANIKNGIDTATNCEQIEWMPFLERLLSQTHLNSYWKAHFHSISEANRQFYAIHTTLFFGARTLRNLNRPIRI